MSDLNELSAAKAAAAIARGEFTSEALVADCLARIEVREGAVQAWAYLDPELALEQARARDGVASIGPLHGVPVGIKDIFETARMPTGMGSPIYDGYRPRADAPTVAMIEAAGGIILGKTVTAEFAATTPGKTANPHNPAHTPGGSSSGSAAAVADFMVPVALGTQTTGSTIRPASFCGTMGYKPTFGRINRDGMKPGAQSLDTVGIFSRTLDDLALLGAVLMGNPQSPIGDLAAPPRIGLCRTPHWQTAAPESVEAVEDAAARLAAAGATVSPCELPEIFTTLNQARGTISHFERARAMTWEWHNHRDQLSDGFAGNLENGWSIPHRDYLAAQDVAAACRSGFAQVMEKLDVVLTPSATGEAPEGLASTGDFTFQGLWTVLHVPCISLPTHSGPRGWRVSGQLVAAAGADDALLAAARWAWDRLR